MNEGAKDFSEKLYKRILLPLPLINALLYDHLLLYGKPDILM